MLSDLDILSSPFVLVRVDGGRAVWEGDAADSDAEARQAAGQPCAKPYRNSLQVFSGSVTAEEVALLYYFQGENKAGQQPASPRSSRTGRTSTSRTAARRRCE